MGTAQFNAMRRKCFRLVIFLMVKVLVRNVAGQEQHFVNEPRNTYILPGESATLYCRVANKTGILFWEKDSTILFKENGPEAGLSGPSTSWAVFGDASQGEYNLQLLGVSKSDQGSYVCMVTSSSGPKAANLTSSEALLTVLDLPTDGAPLCVLSIRDALTEDDVVDLTCAYHSNPSTETTLTWERLNTPADLSNSRQVLRDDGYLIKRHTVTLSAQDDADSYQCIASSPGKESSSCTTGFLSIRHRPIITISPLFLPAKAGDDVRFTCSLTTANPPTVTFQWYYSGAAVTTSSTGIDLIQTPGGDSQILVNNLVDQLGGIPVVCEATNEVGSTTVEAMISFEETQIATISREELILWLVPMSVMVAIVVLLIFLAIAVLDCRPFCHTFCNKSRRPLSPDRSMNSTWSAAENFGMSPSPMVRRLSDADSTDFYVTRAIRTSRPDDDTRDNNTSHESRARFDRNANHRPQRTPSPNYRNCSPDDGTSPRNTHIPSQNYYHSTPIGRPLIISDESRRSGTRHHYEQRRPRNERTRDHYRRSGQPSNSGSQPADSEIRSATRNSALSDSGLDFNASCSIDSRSPTPRDDLVVYAQIMQNRTGHIESGRNQSSASRTENTSLELPPGTPLPSSSTSHQRSTLDVPTEGMHRAHSVELPMS
ncbi:uncharacterized protein LOC110974474 [Acanthaster planci]|uniref:Uncharacterized protein LOC110974474 n=1 Tax=Acanthaster planci TaxID=133434 RepID=A0A8B7XNT1_ACAPL|nr:uncharacterized protein LOC110974474 [Acanthaster planci]